MVNRLFLQRKYNVYRHSSEELIAHYNNDLFEFRVLTIQDLQTCDLCSRKNRLSTFKERLKQGHVCMGHVRRDTQQTISYFWLTSSDGSSTTAPFDFDTKLLVPIGDIYIWDCRIMPVWRNQGVYQNGLSSIIKKNIDRNAWIVSEVKNLTSCRAIEKVGFKKLATLRAIKILPLSLILSCIELKLASRCLSLQKLIKN